ncbi:acetyl esterase [Apiospora kogelbergensis]|uniref:Acetyl esterase n=1 Tax=Apiospora kogelbergensis TaxID=1337665 RepID=A0AAW0QUE0_9PEZI
MRLLLPTIAAAGMAAATYPSGKPPFVVENVVAFGDSYTDAGRLSAYITNNGSTPPPATDTSTGNFTSTGGYVWGQFATQELGAKFYDYAVSGAFCSNNIFERYLVNINRTFPSVLEDEIPSFVEDVAYVNATTGTNTFYPNRAADNTVYALWIGTNDLGGDAFLTDSQHTGLTMTDFIDCIWRVFDAIHAQGGRHFVLLNQAPLERSPLYAAPQNGGAGDNHYWPDKTRHCNNTETEQKILEYTTNVNTMFDYGAPFQLLVNKTRRWPETSFTVFNVHQLMLDIYNEPEKYLDAPANATGYYHHCDVDNKDCANSQNSLSSFMWYDELHPSERTDEIIGKEFVRVVRGNSSYATYW